MRGLFVTGTDTGVGKTVVAAAIAAALHRSGQRVAAFKPVVTGLEEPRDPDWPPDHELLAAAAGVTPEAVAPHRYGPPVSPHLAAAQAGDHLTVAGLAAAARAVAASADVLVVEGVGGLLVPLNDESTIRDLAVDLAFPVIVAARPGLGTLNHTLLTLESARAVGLDVLAVVLTPWPEAPGDIELSNRETLQKRGGAEVLALRRLAAGRPDLLAAAGLELPVHNWIETGGTRSSMS